LQTKKDKSYSVWGPLQDSKEARLWSVLKLHIYWKQSKGVGVHVFLEMLLQGLWLDVCNPLDVMKFNGRTF
jgi:hypothetical protein